MTKAIIFDFDGVIVLSEKKRFQVIRQSALSCGVRIADSAIRRMIGRTTTVFLHELLGEREKPHIPQIVQIYEKEFKGNIVRYVDPIAETVDFIKAYKGPCVFALATMSSRGIIERLIKHIGIENQFSTIVCREDVVHHKPNPEIYEKTIDQVGVSPSECVAIEDTPVGARSALSAGMRCFIFLNELNNKSQFTGIPITGFIRSYEDYEKIGSDCL